MRWILTEAFWQFLEGLMHDENLCFEGRLLRFCLLVCLSLSAVFGVITLGVFTWRYAFGG